jgi:hypothetical protein
VVSASNCLFKLSIKLDSVNGQVSHVKGLQVWSSVIGHLWISSRKFLKGSFSGDQGQMVRSEEVKVSGKFKAKSNKQIFQQIFKVRFLPFLLLYGSLSILSST